MKVALLTTDNREHYRDYNAQYPYFGMAPEALLQGFAASPMSKFTRSPAPAANEIP